MVYLTDLEDLKTAQQLDGEEGDQEEGGFLKILQKQI